MVKFLKRLFKKKTCNTCGYGMLVKGTEGEVVMCVSSQIGQVTYPCKGNVEKWWISKEEKQVMDFVERKSW